MYANTRFDLSKRIQIHTAPFLSTILNEWNSVCLLHFHAHVDIYSLISLLYCLHVKGKRIISKCQNKNTVTGIDKCVRKSLEKFWCLCMFAQMDYVRGFSTFLLIAMFMCIYGSFSSLLIISSQFAHNASLLTPSILYIRVLLYVDICDTNSNCLIACISKFKLTRISRRSRFWVNELLLATIIIILWIELYTCWEILWQMLYRYMPMPSFHEYKSINTTFINLNTIIIIETVHHGARIADIELLTPSIVIIR